jgi:hypothetical protein
VNGEDTTKKMQMFYEVREVFGGRVDPSEDIRPDLPPAMGIDTILGHQTEMDPHTTARKRVLPLSVFHRK